MHYFHNFSSAPHFSIFPGWGDLEGRSGSFGIVWPVFWERRVKKVVDFFEKKSAPRENPDYAYEIAHPPGQKSCGCTWACSGGRRDDDHVTSLDELLYVETRSPIESSRGRPVNKNTKTMGDPDRYTWNTSNAT